MCESSALLYNVWKITRTFWRECHTGGRWLVRAAAAELFKFKTPESEPWLDDTSPHPPTLAPPPILHLHHPLCALPATDAFVDNERIFDSFSSKP